MAASASFSWMAAARLANVSGRLVPRATNVIPVTLVLKPTTQPNSEAIYIHRYDVKKQETNVDDRQTDKTD